MSVWASGAAYRGRGVVQPCWKTSAGRYKKDSKFVLLTSKEIGTSCTVRLNAHLDYYIIMQTRKYSVKLLKF